MHVRVESVILSAIPRNGISAGVAQILRPGIRDRVLNSVRRTNGELRLQGMVVTIPHVRTQVRGAELRIGDNEVLRESVRTEDISSVVRIRDWRQGRVQ